jgi:4-amino-4-deoxy-L-arabinose transferase-like glycosyltransferase
MVKMDEQDIKRIFWSTPALLVYLSLVKLLVPLFTHPDFEFHRDEFLYMAMGDHLALGYLEIPPFIAFIAKLTKSFIGDGLYAMRFIPALAGALTLLLTGLIAKEFGGGRFAQIFAVVAYLLALVYLRMNLFLMPVSFNLFFFVLAVFLLIRIIKNNLWSNCGAVTHSSQENAPG